MVAGPVVMIVAAGAVIMVIMSVRVMIVVMIVRAVIVAVLFVMIGAALGTERALDDAGRGAEAAHHLDQHMILLDEDRVLRDFRRGVTIADMPGEAKKPLRARGRDLDEALRRGLHLDEPPVFELERVAIVEHGRFFQIEQEFQAALARQGRAAPMARLVVEHDAVDNLVGLDRSFTDDGGGAEHG